MEQEEMEYTDENPIEPTRGDAGLWQEIVQQLRLIFLLMRDPEVPLYLKFIPLLGVIYLLSPIDLIPGAIVPIIGGLDDVTALLVAAKVFIDLTPPHIVDKYVGLMRGPSGPAMSDQETPAWDESMIIDAEHEPIEQDGAE